MRRASPPDALQGRVVMLSGCRYGRWFHRCLREPASDDLDPCPRRGEAPNRTATAPKTATRASITRTATTRLSTTLHSTQAGGAGQHASLAVRWHSHGVLERYGCALVVTDLILSRSSPREDGRLGDARFPRRKRIERGPRTRARYCGNPGCRADGWSGRPEFTDLKRSTTGCALS